MSETTGQSSGIFGGLHPNSNPDESTIKRVQAREGSAITKLSEPLNEDNWMAWRERMRRVLRLCGVEAYAEGKIGIPEDTKSAQNWEFNDNYAQVMIINNISSTEMVHVSQCSTAKAMWDNLEVVHESKGHQTIVSVIRNLFHTKASEDSNISEHLNQLKKYWERINQMDDEDFKISDIFFKVIISSSLPLSWDTFTESYVGGRKGMTEIDPKKLMGSQQFIGILKEEYLQRQLRSQKGESINQVFVPKRSLRSRINTKSDQIDEDDDRPCRQCGIDNHTTLRCRHLGKSKCSNCGKFGHTGDKCWDNKGKRKFGNEDRDKGKIRKKRKKEETYEVEEDDDEEHITCNIEEISNNQEMTPEVGGSWSSYVHDDDEAEYYYYNSNNTYNDDSINEAIACYEWFGDSASSSHVTNRREIFKTYETLENTSLMGVGKLKAKAEGKGTIELESRYNNKKYILILQNVLYIPTNRNNLLSLGKWDAAGGKYTGGGGQIILEDKNGNSVAAGTKIDNNLYRLNLKTRSHQRDEVFHSFISNDDIQDWETWHKRYGHIGYSGLQKLIDLKMVDGFTVNNDSRKPDCEICTQAKQTVKPFDGILDRNSKPGEPTHIDLWGKYDIASINKNQYYILFVDDATRYVTVRFLKKKTEAVEHVKYYMQNLKTHSKPPKAIKIDRGKEFLNDQLKTWLDENGLDIQATAPYSPSQNGIAERMNRTLVELGQAMLKGQDLPEFLWDFAIAHAASD